MSSEHVIIAAPSRDVISKHVIIAAPLRDVITKHVVIATANRDVITKHVIIAAPLHDVITKHVIIAAPLRDAQLGGFRQDNRDLRHVALSGGRPFTDLAVRETVFVDCDWFSGCKMYFKQIFCWGHCLHHQVAAHLRDSVTRGIFFWRSKHFNLCFLCVRWWYFKVFQKLFTTLYNY